MHPSNTSLIPTASSAAAPTVQQQPDLTDIVSAADIAVLSSQQPRACFDWLVRVLSETVKQTGVPAFLRADSEKNIVFLESGVAQRQQIIVMDADRGSEYE